MQGQRRVRVGIRLLWAGIPVLAVGLVIGGRPAVAGSLVLYVDKDLVGGACNDSRTVDQASTPSTPWCTIQRAIAAAPGGSEVHVRRGMYRYFEIGGRRPSALLMVKPHSGELVQLSGGFKIQDSSRYRVEASGSPATPRPSRPITLSWRATTSVRGVWWCGG